MQTKTTWTILVVLLGLLVWAQSASAFYNPQTGRWLSRDPIGEPDFNLLTEDVHFGGKGDLNLFGFVGNEPQGRYDYLGLQQVGFPGYPPPAPQPRQHAPDTFPPEPEDCGAWCSECGKYRCETFEVGGRIVTIEIPGITPGRRDVHLLCFTAPCQDPWFQAGDTSLHADPIPYTPSDHPWPFAPATAEGLRRRVPNPPGPPPGVPAEGEFCFFIPWRSWMSTSESSLTSITLRGWCMTCNSDTSEFF